MLLDDQMSQLTVLDETQIIRICDTEKKIKNILVLLCTRNSIFIFPSIKGEKFDFLNIRILSSNF